MWHASFFKGTSDEADVVGCTASAAGLSHDDCGFVQVIFPGEQGIHDLSDYHKGRVAGIIVYIFKTYINGTSVVVGQYFKVVTAGIKCRF